MPKLKTILTSQGAKESVILSGGNIISTGISAVAIILLSRFMGPTAYGAFSIAFALSMLTTKIFDFGYNMSLQKYISIHSQSMLANSLVLHGTKIKLVGSLAIILTAVVVSPSLSVYLHLDSPVMVFLGISLGVIVYWFDFLAYILQGLSKFAGAAGMAITQAATKVLVIAGLVVLTTLAAPQSYLAYGLAPITGLVLGFYLLRHKFKPGPVLSPTLTHGLWQMTKFTAVLTIATALTDYLDLFFVQRLTNSYDTGLYSAASRIALLVAVITYSLNSVLNTRVAKYQSSQLLKKYLKKAWFLAGVCLAGILVVVPLSKILLLLTAGTAYLPVDPTLKLLLIAGVIALATAPLASVFYGLDFPLYFAVSGVLQVGLLVVLNYYFVPLYGLYGAGLARVIMRLTVLIFTAVLIPLLLRRNFGKHDPVSA